jgi:hypothetical protein
MVERAGNEVRNSLTAEKPEPEISPEDQVSGLVRRFLAKSETRHLKLKPRKLERGRRKL